MVNKKIDIKRKTDNLFIFLAFAITATIGLLISAAAGFGTNSYLFSAYSALYTTSLSIAVYWSLTEKIKRKNDL